MVKRKNCGNIYIFTAVWNGVQITCGSEYRHTIRRVSIIQPSLFYFSLRISQSLNGDLYQNRTNLFFFSARKFRQHRTAIYTPHDFQSDFEILNNLRTYDKHYDSLLFKGLNPAKGKSSLRSCGDAQQGTLRT